MTSDLSSYGEKIRAATSAAELDALEQELFGRKQGVMTLSMKELGGLSPEERSKKGQALNKMKQQLEGTLAERRTELKSASAGALGSSDKLDVTLELPSRERGHAHLIPEFIRHVDDVFSRMGFQFVEGPEVESEEYNFNLLNIPETHPARDSQDTFWLCGSENETDPTKRMLLRTHTSGVQVRYAKNHKPPFRIIYHGKTYRKDSDATHSPMFHQFEGMMIGKDVSLANLKATLVTAMRELIGRDVEFRFRTGFFPFVEPGLEMDMMWQGDLEQSREGRWLEMGGCGMVHPNVLKNSGIDPEQWQGFAFGFGVERPLMIKHQIPDLRSFYAGDLRFLKQFC